jgi:bacterioferritin-associated ferredoxin
MGQMAQLAAYAHVEAGLEDAEIVAMIRLATSRWDELRAHIGTVRDCGHQAKRGVHAVSRRPYWRSAQEPARGPSHLF